jgi:hypothetical protein
VVIVTCNGRPHPKMKRAENTTVAPQKEYPYCDIAEFAVPRDGSGHRGTRTLTDRSTRS